MKFKLFSVCILSCLIVFVAFNPTVFATFGNHNPPLYDATAEGNLEEVRRLVTNGNDVNCTGLCRMTLLHIAAIEGYLEIVEYLVNEGHADVNCRDMDGRTPFHRASIVGNLEIVRWLVTEGNVSVNCQDEDGRTALFFAAINA